MYQMHINHSYINLNHVNLFHLLIKGIAFNLTMDINFQQKIEIMIYGVKIVLKCIKEAGGFPILYEFRFKRTLP